MTNHLSHQVIELENDDIHTGHRNVANGVKAVFCIICPHKELSMNSEFISLQGN